MPVFTFKFPTRTSFASAKNSVDMERGRKEASDFKRALTADYDDVLAWRTHGTQQLDGRLCTVGRIYGAIPI